MRYLVMAMTLFAMVGVAHADDKKPAGTAKGAAVGALAGHEVGSGHAVAGAATGAAIGHHQSSKAEKSSSTDKSSGSKQ
jgi:outer membrane lipoprotein SlyB